MKITKQQLKQIIKEEISKVQAENRDARLAQYRRERHAAAKERAAAEASELIDIWKKDILKKDTKATDHDELKKKLKEKFQAWRISLVHKNPSAPQPIISAVRKELLNMEIEGI